MKWTKCFIAGPFWEGARTTKDPKSASSADGDAASPPRGGGRGGQGSPAWPGSLPEADGRGGTEWTKGARGAQGAARRGQRRVPRGGWDAPAPRPGRTARVCDSARGDAPAPLAAVVGTSSVLCVRGARLTPPAGIRRGLPAESPQRRGTLGPLRGRSERGAARRPGWPRSPPDPVSISPHLSCGVFILH